jgi:hypothetical protein
MKNKPQKPLAILLAAVLTLTALPATAFAAATLSVSPSSVSISAQPGYNADALERTIRITAGSDKQYFRVELTGANRSLFVLARRAIICLTPALPAQ